MEAAWTHKLCLHEEQAPVLALQRYVNLRQTESVTLLPMAILLNFLFLVVWV